MKALNDTMAAWVNDEIRRETEPQLVLQAILEFFMLSSASLIAHWLPEDDYDKVDAISNALAQTMAIEVPQIFQRIVEASARGE